MTRSSCTVTLVLVTALGLLAGCATEGSTSASTSASHRGLPAPPRLRAAKTLDTTHAFRRAPAPRRYTTLLIEPVAIYDGADARFAVSAADRRAIADYMQLKVAEVLGERYRIVRAPEPNAVRLRLTLTGVEASTPIVSTLTRLVPLGVVVNAGKQAVGKEGAFLGSVSYAVELSDAASGEVLRAYVTQQAPRALDIKSSVRALDAARTGVRLGAEQLREDLTPYVAAKGTA